MEMMLFILLFASVQGVVATVIMWLCGVELKPPLPEEWELEEQQAKEGEGQQEGQAGEGEEEEPETGFMVAAIPFGPFLALSAIEFLFLGEWFYALLRGGGSA